ncbi:ABC transporter permease [Halobellus salinisoli]|uniref:ABC transporter permease n=1 Tax=Halobellus salinisoli TaxID=3108500 RepID=UPI00300A4DDE
MSTVSLDPEQRTDRLLLNAGFFAVIIAAYVAVAALVDVVPYPQEIVAAFYTQVTTENLTEATVNALYAIFTGYFLAVLVGIPIGLLMGVFSPLEEFFDPYVDALYALPLAAIVPAMIIWFGTGFSVRVAGVFFFSLFPILINTLNGAKNTPEDLLEAARSFGAGKYFIIKNIVIPHEVTYIATGLRIGISLAVKGLVVVEIIVSVTGFGELIFRWGAAVQLEGVFSVVLTLMALGIVLTSLLTRIENRIVHWDVSE